VYVVPGVLALVAVLCAMSYAVLPVCVMLCSCVLMLCSCDVPTSCVFDVFSGYFGNLFGIIRK